MGKRSLEGVHPPRLFSITVRRSAGGRVSRAPRELSAAHNCTRDEGGPFEFGDQEPISSHRKLLRAKSRGGERCGNAGTRFRQARSREASASEPLQKCRKRIRRCRNRGVPLPPGSAWENPEACPSGIPHVGGAKLNQALVRNVRTLSLRCQGKRAAPTARLKVPMRH